MEGQLCCRQTSLSRRNCKQTKILSKSSALPSTGKSRTMLGSRSNIGLRSTWHIGTKGDLLSTYVVCLEFGSFSSRWTSHRAGLFQSNVDLNLKFVTFTRHVKSPWIVHVSIEYFTVIDSLSRHDKSNYHFNIRNIVLDAWHKVDSFLPRQL